MSIASGGSLGTGAHSSSANSFSAVTATNTLSAGDCGLLVVATDNTGTTDGASNEHTGVTGLNGKWTKLAEWRNGNGAAAAGFFRAA